MTPLAELISITENAGNNPTNEGFSLSVAEKNDKAYLVMTIGKEQYTFDPGDVKDIKDFIDVNFK